MDHFTHRDNQLFAENVPVAKIAAQVGTPTYIYSRSTLVTHFLRIQQAFAALKPIVCYSIKSCGNVNIVKMLVEEGSGMDITSGGELYRALKGGCDPRKIVFSGVGKTDREINEALDAGGRLAKGILCFNCESEEEFWNLDRLAGVKGGGAPGGGRAESGGGK